jgi:ClpP class serine protease
MNSRLLELALAEPWAITERYFRIGLALANREGGDVAEADRLRAIAEAPLAAAVVGGQRLEGSRTVTVRDGVALVPMIGALFPHAAMVQRASGPSGASFDTLGRELEIAHASTDVRAVLFLVDTPGGQVSGTNVFAEQIYALRGKGKPVEAYVTGMAASGGYWTMSQTDRITLDESAAVGSIGVALAYLDDREKLARDGVRAIELVSSNAPNKRPDLTSDDGLAVVLADLDRIEATFMQKVARGRGLPLEKVRAEFGRGGLVRGHEAVRLRMADAVDTFENTLARLSRAGARPATRGVVLSNHGSASVMPGDQLATADAASTATGAVPPAEPAAGNPSATPAAGGLVLAVAATAPAAEIAAAFKSAHPAAAALIADAAATAEHDRVLGIQALARTGADATALAPFVADKTKTTADAALALVQADKKASGQAAAALVADAVPPATPATPAIGAPKHDATALAVEARRLVDEAEAAGRKLSYAAATRQAAAAVGA